MPGHSTEIANEFLKRARDAGRQLTQMQLQKLVYLAHGFCLAILDRPLVTDAVEAWDYGPVYRQMYRALREYGADPVQSLIPTGKGFSGAFQQDAFARSALDSEETKIIDQVWQAFGGYEAFQLSALTHMPDTPWSKFYSPSNASTIIPNTAIKEYFRTLRR